MRRLVRLAPALVAAIMLAACQPKGATPGPAEPLAGAPVLAAPGSTELVELREKRAVEGWTFEYYINRAYPCSISGYQTFAIATKNGSSATQRAPLWVYLHGGGAGYFDRTGKPVPGKTHKVQEGFDPLRNSLLTGGVMSLVRDDPAGFRMLAVSYCNHDVYAGGNNADPNNPNTAPDGKSRTVNGLFATKAAIAFAESKYTTSTRFLHGSSAGSVGAFGVAWSLQLQGIPPAGVIADASVANMDAFDAGYRAGVCADSFDPARTSAVAARLHPDLASRGNEPDRLVSAGRLTVPLLHIWNHGDQISCGLSPIACPLRDGTTVKMGITDCIHEPLRAAIAAQGKESRSVNLPVCVDTDVIADCSEHGVTNEPGAKNTDPSTPADFQPAILDWVHNRLKDS